MPASPFFAAYTGPSMNPTLVEPELMEVAPGDGAAASVGDVILFVHPASGAQIVHRVVRVTGTGLTTRGDNSAQDDADLCPPAAVRGRVVAAWRGQRRRIIQGGHLGQLWAWCLRGHHLLLVLSVRLLSRPYHALARAGVLWRLIPPALRPRVLVFQSDGAPLFRLVAGGRVVGEYDPARGAWRVQPPYLLLVDEASLPGRPPARASSTPAKT